MRFSAAARAALLGAAVGALCGLAACSRPKKKMPDLRLPTLSGSETVPVNQCPSKRCLTVYVTPWCGNCRKETGEFLKLRDLVKERGVTTRFIVGNDTEPEVRAYAKEYGPDTLLDPLGKFPAQGVPEFLVSDSTGSILNTARGVPSFVTNEKALAWYLGID